MTVCTAHEYAGPKACPYCANNDAYTERNQLVAFLARQFPSGIRKTEIPGWDPCWHGCVFIDTPQGQLSWHYHDSDAGLFADLPPYAAPWDGHSTPEKYRRLWRLTAPAVWFVFEIDRRARTVTLSKEFAGIPERTVAWDAARLSDGRSFDAWEPADCTPVELLPPERPG